MENKKTLRSLFAPLGLRLNYFESEKYLTDPGSTEYWSIDSVTYHYQELVETISKEVNNFKPTKVYQIANEYLNRIISLVNKIGIDKLAPPEVTKGIHKKSTAEDSVKKYGTEWGEEFYYYLLHLSIIRDLRKEYEKKELQPIESKSPKNVIQLPEGFKVSQIQQHFTQTLSHNEVTLLMYYMKEVGIMPPFEQGEFSKLAPAFFGYHDKTIAKDLRFFRAPIKSKKDLSNLKKTVEKLLSHITDDFSKALK